MGLEESPRGDNASIGGDQSRSDWKIPCLHDGKPLKIRIKSRSDKERDGQRRLLWGDYWVKHELSREFTQFGVSIVEKDEDALIHLFGSPAKNMSGNSYCAVWLYSHPDMVTSENLKQYDKIYCASSNFTKTLLEMGYANVETMYASTSKRPSSVPIKYDIVFVGNARTRKPEGRSIIRDIGYTRHNLKVWGNLWEDILPDRYYGGRYWDYLELERLYASALITLNDHHSDMSREGFVSNKIFDILASGGFAISKHNKGIKTIFGEAVPQYQAPEELVNLVDYYIENPEERERLMLKGRRIALQHTYKDRAWRFLKGIIPDLPELLEIDDYPDLIK